MDIPQEVFNYAVTVVGALAGWLGRIMWQTLKDQQEQNARLTEKVAQLQILVVGEYVKKDDLQRDVNAIFTKLDRIEDKLDKKVDK